jgi:membrane-associated phospholipid phosphatase
VRPEASGMAGAEPKAGTWKPWVLASADQVKVPPPPKGSQADAEEDEVTAAAANVTDQARETATRWSGYPPTAPWLNFAMQLVSETRPPPPMAARQYGLVSVAMYDAVIATWHWKYVYDRDPPAVSGLFPAGPDPSYPSEHAAMAGAASRVLAYLFPGRPQASYDELAQQAADSRVAAGANFRSDVQAGLDLGRAVADQVIVHARGDGAERRGEFNQPRGRGYWAPPPGAPPERRQPAAPLAGTWHPWAIDANQLVPAPPPSYGSPEFRAETREVVETVRNLTEEQKRVADRWAAPVGSSTPPGLWNTIAIDTLRGTSRLSTPQVARLFAALNVAECDAGIAAWATKYRYWSARPVNAARDLGLDPNFKSYLPTPVFPSYVSGHATFSSAAAEVLSYFLPEKAETFRAQAQEAAMSRLYGGIHFRSDNEVGLEVGRRVGAAVVERARHDGADPAGMQHPEGHHD